MDTLNASNRNLLVGVVAGVVVGLLIGVFFGWRIPVTNVPPVDLHPGYRNFYLQKVAEQYNQTRDLATVRNLLGADRDRWASKDIATELRSLAKTSSNPAPLEELATALSVAPAVSKPATTGPNMLALVAAVALAVLVIAGAALLILWLRSRQVTGTVTPAMPRGAVPSGAAEAPVWAGEAEKPLAQYVTTYELGDDRYDTSFSIETPTGEFLGECGVGIGETIGVGDPDKATAFEVWLFDKNDIRTVTKVLMSEYAYGDQALRAKLAPKGEPELARPDAVIDIETASLKIRARVVEMDYGQGELQARSFFNKLTLELAAWTKEAAPASAAGAE